jgi:Ca-activated chloride channel family protein
VQVEELDLAILTFERIRELRAEEPQSHRDLALALAARAEKRAGRTANRGAALSDYQRSLDLLADVVLDEWDRFAEIELIALVELNDVLPKAQALGDIRVPVDARLIQQLDMDVRIVMSWDADLTDMDLHVVEPSGEEAYYGHSRTAIGGRVSRDFTQGYGPEEYSIRRAMPGTYELKTKFFGSSAAQLQGAVTLYVDLYTDYGRPNQKKQSITLRLAEQKDTFTVGEITIAAGGGLQITR